MSKFSKYQFEIVFISFSIVFFSLFIGADYYSSFVEGKSWSLDADSRKYVLFSSTDYFKENPLISLGSNFIGPFLTLKVFNYSNFAIFVFNLVSLLIPCHFIFKFYDIKRNYFFLWLFANPFIFFSLFTVNKEIAAVAWVLLLLCYLKSKKISYLLFAIFYSILARYQLSFLTIFFLIAELAQKRFKFKRKTIIISLIFLLSLSLPLFNRQVDVLSFESDADAWESAAERKLGLLSTLNFLQNNYFLFFIVFIPKIVLNLIGPLYKIFFNLKVVMETFISNFYNIFITTVGAFFFDVVLIKACLKRVLSLDFDEVYLGTAIVIFYMTNPILQIRYIIPVYILGVIAITRRISNKSSYEY